jgi:hypothetical protein
MEYLEAIMGLVRNKREQGICARLGWNLDGMAVRK